MNQPTRRTVLCALLAATALHGAGAATVDAAGFVDQLGQRTIAALDRLGGDPAARRQAVSALLDETVDLALIARLCLGRHWRTAGKEQRTQYVDLFRANVLAVLSRRMSYYTGGEKFVVTASRPARDDAMVASEIIYATNDPPLKIEWRVRVTDGRPIIIDVLPEGVSLVLTYRSEFDEVVARSGMDGLLAELRDRAVARAKPA
jgi:phospholipid transport system substrate-binding protein